MPAPITPDRESTPFDNDVMRRKLPAELDDLLEAEMRLIEANALAQRWDACHRAIDRLAAEAVLARPWLLPLADRLALTPQEIGLTLRVANMVEAAGLETVDALLDASEDRLLELPNFGRVAIAEIKERLRSLFRNECRAGDPTGIFARVADWPKREYAVELPDA